MASGIDIGSFTGSDFKGDEAIKKIMEAEAKGKTPIENEKFRLQMQKQAWSGLQSKLSDLNTATRNFSSPAYSSFRKIKTDSSSPDVLNISSDGVDVSKLKPANYSIIPKQMANMDHFKSDILTDSENLQAAQFNILYQNKKYPVNFTGGSLDDLANTLNQVGENFLKASVIPSNDGKYLDIEGKNIGKKEKIEFDGNTDFLKNIGLLRNALPTYYNIELNNPIGLSGSKDIPDLLLNEQLQLKPKDTVTKKLPLPQNINSETQLWIFLKHPLLKEKSTQSEPQKNSSQATDIKPITGFIDKIWVGDVNLTGEPLITEFKTSSEPSKTGQKQPSELQKNLQPNPKNPDTQLTISLEYADGKRLTAKTFFNPETESIQVVKSAVNNGQLTAVTIKNDSIFDLEISKGELITFNRNKFDNKNVITKAQNAILNYRGTDYERGSNTIKDIVPGTLSIQSESDKPVKLTVDFDYDAILDQLKQWIIAYNNTMDFIRNITQESADLRSRMNRDRNQEITEKREAYAKLSSEDKNQMRLDGSLFEGFLNGDSSVSMIKTKLQSFISKAYTTDAKEKIMFLRQLGVSIPNASQLSSMSESERQNYRAGYLDFTEDDQKKFLGLLKEYFIPVQQFFFKRTQGSQLYNEGMFVDYNNLLNLYLQRYFGKLPGFFPAKTQLLDSQIQAQDKKMNQLDDKMKRDETKLRNDFSKVYDAQSRAKSLNNQFSRFGRSE